MDCCWLCGVDLKGKRRRYQDAEGLKAMVRERCKASPFAHAWLGTTRAVQAAREPLCVPCVNWRRRVCNGTLKKRAHPHLQIDQLIMYLLQPGVHQEPDARCLARLVGATRQPGGNCMLHTFPLPALRVLERMEGGTAEAGLRAWWDYNDRTEFFAHHETARRVRTMLKAEERGLSPR